ncbi:hypothetical protein [Mycobacteroides chelonae]|uniref:DUF3987 domain-containing protein n=1 Tax=Mycobacteroides chelonae TaxID=1774 RepID=A0A1S1M654_MYCCH|nr:hypothetical protein [Mycobacteroides chelonae]OHU78013.1 hypothetical protein BKG84_06020 [Mycobacteroides chelonae]
MTDDEFFTATPELQTIYRWARARYAAPWAVFFAVLLRVAASVAPHVQLPGVIGGRASLNLLCAFVAPSGGGKGISDKVARLAWPSSVKELPIGSGEGIAETFTLRGMESEDNERVTNAIFSCSEIDVLTGLESRQGSTTLGTMKAFAMGEQFGSTNASRGNSRNVPAHSYRGCLSVGAQPGHTGVIFNDTTGGTPQRFLWALTIDPDMPADSVADPEPLNHHVPGLLTRRHDDPDIVTEIVYGPPEIRQTIIAAHLARQRGEGDALDGHWMLTRCKVAALLAILHHRSVVSELDWQLSEVVMAHSDRTRDWIVSEAKKAQRAKVRDRAMSRAAGEQFISDHKLDRAKKAVLRWLERDGAMARHNLRRRLKADLREHFDPALAELIADGQIHVEEVTNGESYALTSESTRVPEVHPPKAQVNARVPQVHGVPAATVTELDYRRSSDSERPKRLCPQWLADYIADLVTRGETTVSSLTVYTEGKAQGYSPSSIGNAITAHDDMTIIGQDGASKVYSLTGQTTGYKPLIQWVNDYLDALPANTESLDKEQARQAVEAESAGYSWEAARRVFLGSGRVQSAPDPGGDSRKTIWTITDTANQETSA